MKPIVIETQIDLPGSPELVWRLLTDWERQGDWMLEATDFVVMSPNREGIGVEADATIRIGGISTRDRVRIDIWRPFTRLGILHLGWVGGRGDMAMTPTAFGVRLDWREELHPPLGLVGALGMRAFRPLMARIFRRDAAVLAQLVGEATNGRYPKSDS